MDCDNDFNRKLSMYKYRFHLLFYIAFLYNLFSPLSLASASSNSNSTDNHNMYSLAIKQSVADPTDLFNQSLTFIKQQNFGLALAYLREVQLLMPRHRGTQQALDYIQHQLLSRGFKPEDSLLADIESSFLNYFLLPEILTFHWIFSLILLLTLSQLYRSRRKARLKQEPLPLWKTSHWILSGIWCLTTLILLIKVTVSVDQRASVISTNSTALLSGPLSDAAELGQIPEGSLVVVSDFHENWVQVKVHNLPMGWIPRNSLLIHTPNGFK